MKKIIVLFVIWRTYLFAVAAFAPVFPSVIIEFYLKLPQEIAPLLDFIFSIVLPLPSSEFRPSFPYYEERLIATGLPHLIWSFGNFDGVHYLGIAQSGYSAQFTQAFFPLYPITIKLISNLFNTFLNETTSLFISALLISNAAFLAAIAIFYKLIKNYFSEKIAFWSIMFLLFFPTSFYFGSIYTESAFFLLLISSYYLVERNKLLFASLTGTLASLTRLIGVFLSFTLTYRSNQKVIIPLILIPIGLIIYVLFLQIEFNNPLYFISAQQAFGNERSTSSIILLPQVIFRYFKIILTTNGSQRFTPSIELISTFFAVSLLLLSLREKRIKKEWVTFSLLSVIFPTLTGTLSSMPRYIILSFPIYIFLALIKNNFIKITILIVFLIYLTLLTARFSQGYWVA